MNRHGDSTQDESMLTDAATRALDELLTERREQVLKAAREASPNEVLTAADVVRAYYSTAHRRPPAVQQNGPSYPAMRLWLLVGLLMIFVFSIVAGSYYVSLIEAGVEKPDKSLPLPLIVLISGAMALWLSTLVLIRQRRRRFLASQPTRRAPDQVVEVRETYDPLGFSVGVIGESDVRFTFLRKWSAVEDSLQELAKSAHRSAGRQVSPRLPIGAVVPMLLSDGVIDERLSTDLRRVIAVRNLIAHERPVPQDQIREGVELLHTLEERLAKLRHSSR